MSTKSSTSSNKKKRDYDGRVFIFTARKHYKDQCQLAKTMISDMDMDPSEIKIDDKPYLSEIMTKLSNGRTDLPQIFFNDTYIGGLDELARFKERGVLKQMIEEAKNASDPGPLYKVYRTQNELFLISLPDLYFPPPLNRQITCVVRLINRTNKYTVYKLKTTNPKKFNVSPKQGFLPPGQSERLEVTMNDADVPTKQDKFRVEGILLSYGSDDMKNMVEDVFKQADAKSIIKQTINCKFEAPPENMKITQYNDGTIMVEELNVPASIADELIPNMTKSSHEASREDDLSPKWIETTSQLDRIPESMTQSFMQDDVSSPMFQSMNEYHIPVSPRQPKSETVATANTTQIAESVPYIDTSAGYVNVPSSVEHHQSQQLQTDSNELSAATVTDQYDREQEDSERIAREREETERREREESLLREQQQKREQEQREQERRDQERKDQERKEQERREEEQQREQARREQEQREQEEALKNAKLIQEKERREREKREEEERLKRIEDEKELRKLEELAKETKETIEKRVSKKETQQLLQQIDSVEYEKLKEEYKRLVDQLKSVVEQNKALEENYRSEIQKQKEKVREVEDLLASERSLRKRNVSADKSSAVVSKSSIATEASSLPTEQQYDLMFVIIVALVAFIFGWLM